MLVNDGEALIPWKAKYWRQRTWRNTLSGFSGAASMGQDVGYQWLSSRIVELALPAAVRVYWRFRSDQDSFSIQLGAHDSMLGYGCCSSIHHRRQTEMQWQKKLQTLSMKCIDGVQSWSNLAKSCREARPQGWGIAQAGNEDLVGPLRWSISQWRIIRHIISSLSYNPVHNHRLPWRNASKAASRRSRTTSVNADVYPANV